MGGILAGQDHQLASVALANTGLGEKEGAVSGSVFVVEPGLVTEGIDAVGTF